MVQPIQRVNVDLTATMLEELDKAAQDLNVTARQLSKHLSGKLWINTIWLNAPAALDPDMPGV